MRVVVQKSARLLRVTEEDKVLFSCRVSLGADPIGPKRMEGDGKTPEGKYMLCTRNPQSKFYLSLGLSYPSAADANIAVREGRISEEEREAIALAEQEKRRPPWDTPLGGMIMIHGEHPDGRTGDWTAGCIAVANEHMETLFSLCSLGTPVEILP